MSFLQAYYTSCERGLRGSKGFQINAATEGLDPSLLQQVERLGLYVPPVEAPSRPTAEEIERFPVSLLYQRLGDDHGVLAQAKYLGTDYSGRFGNYFTHSLVSLDLTRDIKDKGFLPIEMWQSETWETRESVSTSLTAVETPSTGSVVTPQAVEEFLHEDDRLQHLSSFITAIERALSSGRRLIMVADSGTVALWIAVASYSLPSHLALRLTFNTYVKNPYQTEFLIVGTTPDSDFNFAPHEIEHQYYVFDFHSRRFTVITDISDFAAQVADAYRDGHSEGIAEFSRFVEEVSPDLHLEELDLAFACHALISGFGNPGPNTSRIIKWCAKHLGGFNQDQIRAVLSGAIDGGSVDGDIVEACTDMFLALEQSNPKTQVRQVIERPYLEWLIKDVGARATTGVLMEVSHRLHIPERLASEVESSRLLWMKQLRETDEPKRLYILFVLGDKLGFLNEPDEILRYLGKTKIGPWLSEVPVEDILNTFFNRSAMRDVIYGIGEYLGTQVSQPQVFTAAYKSLVHPEVVKTLVTYVTERKDLNLYFRLVGTQIAGPSCRAEDRLKAFQQCLDGAKRFDLPFEPGLVGNAFAAVWHNHAPTIEEAGSLLDILEGLRVTDASIPTRLVDLLDVSETGLLDARQKDLARRLGASPVYENLGNRAVRIDAFYLAGHLMGDGDDSTNTVEDTLDFLRTHSALLDEQSKTTVFSLMARRLAHIKDEENHRVLLIRAYRNNGSAFFLRSYGQEVMTSLAKHSSGKEREVARLVKIWIDTERTTGVDLSDHLFGKILPQALRDWRVKDLEAVDKGLLKSRAAHLRWIKWREGFREQSGFRRLKRWFPFR